MRSKVVTSAIISLLLLFSFTNVVTARNQFEYNENSNPVSLKPYADAPNQDFRVHNIGKLALLITNYGNFGKGNASYFCDGEECPDAEYPINSELEYLYTGSLWIGGIVGRDTLVSTGSDGWFGIEELLPDPAPGGIIESRSNIASRIEEYHPDAISEQDFICTFTDTNTLQPQVDATDNRPHIPLNVAVKQSSYAWSYDYAEDFVLFDYKITNIGIYPLQQVYLALYIDADVYHRSETEGYADDICGFRRTVPMLPGYGFDDDSVNIAWIADNDGNPSDGTAGPPGWTFTSLTSVTGTRVVRSPNEDLNYTFNWWVSHGTVSLDFAPRMAGTDDDPFRSFGPPLGTPLGDKNKYYVMSHPEFDYDQLYTAMSHGSEGYLAPPREALATDIANGYDTRYLLSFGPFDISPGDTLPVTIAYIAGEDFHDGPNDFANYFDTYQPDDFYNKLDFTDIGNNARWASWIFDNPGYDSNEDGDSGRYNWSCPHGDSIAYFAEDSEDLLLWDTLLATCKKIYYAGDGVPDFRGAAPPPPPIIEVFPGFGTMTIRWNGQLSENAIDVFSGNMDFEGYRVYSSLTDRVSDFVLMTSYDLEDYKRFEFNPILLIWEQTTTPLPLDSLQTLFGPSFDPLVYTDEFNYFTEPGSGKLVYFTRQDWNQSSLTDPNGIHKVYPNASRTDLSDTTDAGFLRYYEYEYEITNLQPSIPYHFSVTAFDFGSLKVDLGALESSPLINAIEDYPLAGSETVENEALSVIVYPNPYRIDGGYAAAGYENRDRTKAAERTRKINFANLPKVCTIRIFSIDGDLIKEIEHDNPDGGPGSQHEAWDVISRNTQSVVTGLYLWQVESDMGEQIGKLVIIK
ncbi:MAG: hypothetical protein KAR42_13235 [candidate division Zixibacteria bacterium]|nr:hypothetical protein [candidate division Zixibacteria bacterium]